MTTRPLAPWPGTRAAPLVLATWLFGAALGLGCGGEREAHPPVAPGKATPDEDAWPQHGRDAGEQRFSPLSAIHDGNVGELGLAWSHALPTRRGLEATPIVVDGVMYLTSTWGRVHALDAATGRMRWEYDPQVPGQTARDACCDIVNRGVAVSNGRVYVGVLDGRLIALDARSGAPLWEVTTVDRTKPYTITGAPRVVKDKVVIGNGGADFGVRGYVSAYDAESGALAWRFYTVPGDPSLPFEHEELAAAARTWSGRWWENGGGGTVWDSMAFDPALDLLYVGTGNGHPWPRHERSPTGGDNLFLSSILALDPDDGRLVWHYQTTPGDSWDYTASQHMILADLEIDGVLRAVLMQAPKNGFFYVLDRATGELLSAEPYVTVSWASHVDLATGRPVETAQADYADAAKLVFPSGGGGHNWQPMSFHPGTGLVYIPAIELSQVFGDATLADAAALSSGQPTTPPGGWLKAWDPTRGRAAWQVRHPGLWNGGVLSTSGNLVFQGDGGGHLYAFAADTGRPLLDIEVGTGIIAPPITYRVDGEQYVAVMAGFGGAWLNYLDASTAAARYENGGRILAFKLGGGPVPLPPERIRHAFPEPPPLDAAPATIARGEALYQDHCGRCHGHAGGESLLPDLRRMDRVTHARFAAIVLGGERAAGGMPSFADRLDAADVTAIQTFVVDQTHRARREAATH